jgi:hypothetical protein
MRLSSLLVPALPVVFVALATSCETYVAPPVVSIDGLSNGLLEDPAAPITLQFSKAIDPSTLSLKIIRFEPDADGELADELGDPTVSLSPLYAHDPIAGDSGGTGTLDTTATTFTIVPSARLPVGPKLAVLVEPGLSDAAHDDTATTAVRKRLLFAYAFTCKGTGTALLSSGAYFFLLDVEQPIGTQVRLFASLDVDAGTGRFTGQFTRADRITDPTRCAPPCSDGNVCKTLPGPPACVAPSTRAGTPSEYPDFDPDPTPPVGFTFTVGGCAEDQPDGTATFATEPANLAVEQPQVSLDGLLIVASFAKTSGGDLTATGSGTCDDVVFGSAHLGPGHGTVQATSMPAGRAPAGIPMPPPTGDM